MLDDYYKILGVEKNATEQQIKSAFRKLSMKWHPDMQHGKTQKEKDEAKQQFQKIAEAYEVLSDKDKRNAYDNKDNNFNPFGNGGMDIEDFIRRNFKMFNGFGDFDQNYNFDQNYSDINQKYSNADGNDIQATFSISFKESLLGCNRNISVAAQTECNECSGTGIEKNSKPKICKTCNGAGCLVKKQKTLFGISIVQTICPDCHGKKTNIDNCKKCNGTGRIDLADKKYINFRIPAGVMDHSRLRITGAGQCGIRGGNNGDLFININVKKPEDFDIFSRMEIPEDLLIDNFPIDAITATVGGEVLVPTLKGFKKLKIPAGTKNGKIFKLKGEGIFDKMLSNKKGDLYIKINIQPLVNLSDDQIQKLNKFKNNLNKESFKFYNHFYDKSLKFFEK